MSRMALLALVALAWPATVGNVGAQSADQTLRLPLGDPRLREKDVPLVLDGITDAATGDIIAPGDLPARLANVRLLLLGESHTSVESHRVQQRVIEVLSAAGRQVHIGLEMFPATEQASLDQWSEGLLTEQGFVKLSGWYEHWGYHWQYYREVFTFARDHGLPLVAINSPRDVVATVRRKGLANLTPEESSHLPPSGVDVDSDDHMTFFKASFEEGDQLHGGMSDEAWKNMLSAQATWDATMGWNATQALKQANDPKAIMVVLVGSGHVAYGLGIARQAKRWFDGGIASLIAVPVASPDGEATVDTVRASYADFLWGVPPELAAPFPRLGISTRANDDGHRVVLRVEDDSAAARAGFAVNDVIVSMDGHPVPDAETLSALISHKAWGDAATFVVKRDDQEEILTAYFRRTPPRRKAPPSAHPPPEGRAEPQSGPPPHR